MTAFEAKNPDFQKYVSGAVLSMPAAKWLGFGFKSLEPGHAELELQARPELTQHNGYFQGGVLGALLDFAGGSAAGTLLPAGWINMTADYTIKLLSPANGSHVIARGRVVHASQTTTVAGVDLYAVNGDSESLCATGLVTMRNMPLKG